MIEACKRARVPILVYTSSIDVVFKGEPVVNGKESDLTYGDDRFVFLKKKKKKKKKEQQKHREEEQQEEK